MMNTEDVFSVRLMTFMLLIPTGLYLIWSVFSVTCKACEGSDDTPEERSGMSNMLSTMFNKAWLSLWYILWFVWWSSSVACCFVGDSSTFTQSKMLGLCGNALSSVLWWVMIGEYCRPPFQGFTARRIRSLLLHRLLLVVWSVSLYVVLRASRASRADSATWYFGFVAWCFVGCLAVFWELFFVRHVTREESSWFPTGV